MNNSQISDDKSNTKRWELEEGQNVSSTQESSYPLFVELAQLEGDEWREAARWVKYEEDIEPGGQRWSKPYCGVVQVRTITQLGQILENADFDMDLNCDNEEKMCRILVDKWVNQGSILGIERNRVLHTLLRPHVHLYENSSNLSIPGLFRKMKKEGKSYQGRRDSILSVVFQPQIKDDDKKNKQFLRKLPKNSECGNIMVGCVSGLSKPIAAFLRLSKSSILGNFTEVPVPTRFVFIFLGPLGTNCWEIGRALGCLLTDPEFKALAYKAASKEEITNGINDFLNKTSILPSVWDSSIRLEPPDKSSGAAAEGENETEEDDSLEKTGIPFGGLYRDLKRKIPFYPSDFRDALSLQVLATWLFLYFACLTPMITFGALMGEVTHGGMGTIETIVAGSICGIVFALFSGQPLLILGSTGPVLIFEKILVNFSESNELNYLEFRLWVGLWIAVILMLLVASDASSYVRYITKFTEDNFATLIACIFMVEAVKNVLSIADDHSGQDSFSNNTNQEEIETDQVVKMLIKKSTFLMSLLLFFGTFAASYLLKEFRLSSFFPTWVRYLISDFAVILAILVMTMTDYFSGVPTPKLNVPEKFAPTSDSREWFIVPLRYNPMWSIFAALIPALFATILIFMDQQITAVIVNRKDHKLQKGCGYHLDLFVLSILITIGSLFGLPWFVAATVESLTNIGSLKQESESNAPGEKPESLGVREQRVSNLLVFSTVGISVLLTPVLKHVPMPVLYGVFLYMGFSALRKMELFHRILLLFMPLKYQPDFPFLRQVPLSKVHLFTLIQVLCLGILWAIKSIKSVAILFPLMLLVMMIIRKLLDFVFTQQELIALDDPLPGSKKNEQVEISKL